MEEPNLLLLRPIFNGLELDATVDGEERNGVVYVDIADLAEALEERPPPSLMVAVPDLRDYFPAQFDIDLRTQRLLIFGRGETAIERRFQEEYEAIRYQPPLLEYPLVEPAAAPLAGDAVLRCFATASGTTKITTIYPVIPLRCLAIY